jgi:hypothetical protein
MEHVNYLRTQRRKEHEFRRKTSFSYSGFNNHFNDRTLPLSTMIKEIALNIIGTVIGYWVADQIIWNFASDRIVSIRQEKPIRTTTTPVTSETGR